MDQVGQGDQRAVHTPNTAEILIKTPERKSFLIARALASGNPLWIILSVAQEATTRWQDAWQ